MSDVCCNQCGEMWDHNYIIGNFEIREMEDVEKQMSGVILDSAGQWWKFGFFYPDQFYEANYLIEMCPACEPRVGHQKCKWCFGTGRVYVRRLRRIAYKNHQGWWVGYSVTLDYPHAPFRRGRPYQCVDGWVERGYGFCPECFKDHEEYVAAMAVAGWTEPVRHPNGILHQMAAKAKET